MSGRFMSMLTFLLFFSPHLILGAAPPPSYWSKIPATVCTPAADIDENIQSCDDNKILLERAQKCADKFQELRQTVANQAVSRFQKLDDGKQKKNFGASQAGRR